MSKTKTVPNNQPKNPTKLFPLIVTDKLAETRAFYTEKVGATVHTDMEGYLAVRLGDGEDAPELSFMAPDGRHGEFAGGLIVSVPVPNADDKCRDLQAVGVAVMGEPEDRPWGWRSFATTDPSGVMLDFFHVVADKSLDAAS